MIFRQITHDDLGCASYLLGDESAGVVAVVDPKFEFDEYLELARYLGVSIEHILETHTHADHVSGRARLATATGARIHVHRAAEVHYDHEGFDDGWELQLGAVRVQAIHTPGHRPEHTAFAVIDTARADQPWAVLTGDSLFVGDIARPDLAVHAEQGAHAMFRSLHQRLLSLPPQTEVWPGHLGGSLCGGPGMDAKICSTVGYERAHNDLLREPDEDRFVARTIAALAPQPPNFKAIVELNRGTAVTQEAPLLPLAPRQVEQKRAAGALIVDGRTDLLFDEAHIPGAVCIPALQAGFGTRLAWLAERDQEIVLIGRDDHDASRAAQLASAVGIRKLAGYLAGGMTEWRREQREVRRIERLKLESLPARSRSDPRLQILDVREQSERDQGYIPGSLFAPWHDIHELPAGLERTRAVAVLCASGQRAAVAGSLLQRYGAEHVVHVVEGGVPRWAELGEPIVHER